MLEHRFRFHGYGSLNYLYRHGQTTRTKVLSIRSVTNPHRVHARVAIVVSKKIYKASPKRNRIRRRIYEILRTNWQRISPDHDIVITVFDPGTLVMPYAELEESVVGGLRQAGLWQDQPKNS